VFQDPHSAFDPSATLLGALREPMRAQLTLSRAEQRDRARELMELVGLGEHLLDRFPHELSGGQLQRIAVARALVVEPKVVVLDEPVSSLDVSTQAQVVNLLRDLQARLGVAYLFIAHDLAVVRHVSDDLSVMYLGRIVEQGRADAIYATPHHPYTEALLSAIPVPDPVRQRRRERIILRGDIPAPASACTGEYAVGVNDRPLPSPANTWMLASTLQPSVVNRSSPTTARPSRAISTPPGRALAAPRCPRFAFESRAAIPRLDCDDSPPTAPPTAPPTR